MLEYFHASFMIAAFIFMIAAFIAVKFFKKRLCWLKFHKTSGIVGAILVVTGLFIEIINLSMIDAGHFNVPHAYIGLVIVLMSLLMPVLGFMQFRFRENISKIKPLHRWLGRALLLLMVINIISGFYAAGIL